jgi:hypothetical protein
MAFSRDKILKIWDEVIDRIAREPDDPTENEMAAATAEVCAKCPGLTPDEIGDALRASAEEEEVKAVSAQRALEMVEMIFKGLPTGTLTFEEEIRLKSKQGNKAVRELLKAPIASTASATMAVDVEEVARALVQMFAASAELREKEPDMDVILDVLAEQFPGITMGHIAKAGAMMREWTGNRGEHRPPPRSRT